MIICSKERLLPRYFLLNRANYKTIQLSTIFQTSSSNMKIRPFLLICILSFQFLGVQCDLDVLLCFEGFSGSKIYTLS